jgi:SAM-dependent methyltransferase
LLGHTLDYYLLRSLSHSRNIATSEQLDHRKPPFEAKESLARLNKLNHRIGGQFPLGPNLRYLDIGCGDGEITLGIVLAGGGHVTGVDIEARNIQFARQNAAETGLEDRAEFVQADIDRWEAREPFDVVLSHEALEHIHDPGRFLHRMGDFVKPDGVIVLAFGPLFHSPVGDHMDGFFRVPVLWRGVLFSESAVLRLRREVFRPSEPAQRYEDIVGGLNRMRYTEFLKYTAERYEFQYLGVNPQLEVIRPLKLISDAVVRIPVLRDYAATSVYAVLKKRPGR